MKNRKLYQQLQRIIETSLSPKRKTGLDATRLLCNPNISLPNIKTMENSRISGFKNKNSKLTFFNKNEWKQTIVSQIQRKKIQLQPPLTAWQIRQNSFSNNNVSKIVSNNQQENLGQIVAKLSIKFGKNYKILQIVMLEAQGRRKLAISKIFQWLLGWVKSLFTIFSNIISKKVQHL